VGLFYVLVAWERSLVSQKQAKDLTQASTMAEISKLQCGRSIPDEFDPTNQTQVLQRLGERIGVKANITTAPTFLVLGR
jgi:hypothetical protein